MTKQSPPKESKQPLKEKLSFDNMTIDQNLTIDEIKENFPELYGELTNKKMSMSIDEIKGDFTYPFQQDGVPQEKDPFAKYDPTVYDFLSRARTNEEGFEIINFLAKQGQISSKTAKDLTQRLTASGIRHFGPFRSSDYYYRKAEEIRNRRSIQKRYPSRELDETKD